MPTEEGRIDVYRGAKNLDILRMQVFYHCDNARSETSIHMSREGSGAAFLSRIQNSSLFELDIAGNSAAFTGRGC